MKTDKNIRMLVINKGNRTVGCVEITNTDCYGAIDKILNNLGQGYVKDGASSYNIELEYGEEYDLNSNDQFLDVAKLQIIKDDEIIFTLSTHIVHLLSGAVDKDGNEFNCNNSQKSIVVNVDGEPAYCVMAPVTIRDQNELILQTKDVMYGIAKDCDVNANIDVYVNTQIEAMTESTQGVMVKVIAEGYIDAAATLVTCYSLED